MECLGLMSSRLSLGQLRALHAVMVTGSIAAAAERLNLTQPAISKQLSNLEHGLDLRLFNRQSGRTTTPTQQGIDFFKAIEGTIAGLDELDAVADGVRSGGQRRIRIAATPPLINSAPMMRALAQFRHAFPDVFVSLEPRHRLEIEDWVATRQIDIALALLPTNHPRLREIPFIETEAVAVMRKDHPLAKQRHLRLADLRGHKLILPSRQPLRARMDLEMDRRGEAARADLESSSAITCCRMAAAGLGVALCDPFSVTAFEGSGIVACAWQPRVALTYGVIVNRSVPLDETLETLTTHLTCEFNTGKKPAFAD